MLAARTYYPSSHPRAADGFSKALRQLKSGDAKLLDPFVLFMVSWIVSLDGSLCKADIVIPIPTDPYRLADRGFAISETLASAIAFTISLPALRALSLTRSTNDLRQMCSYQRKQEIRGAFAVEKPQQVRGKSVLLVDDILTTGATIQEATKVLMEAEAQRVQAVVIARSLNGDFRPLPSVNVLRSTCDCDVTISPGTEVSNVR